MPNKFGSLVWTVAKTGTPGAVPPARIIEFNNKDLSRTVFVTSLCLTPTEILTSSLTS